ncbi:MAG: GGDEF domain-containing protein [Bdellovibrionales bacterium]|nr:GGDEF domain-containing protein [Bdellovibrionales bacterium]
MKIDEIRTSFTVYLIASDLKRFEGVAESLGLAGYMVASFSELTAAFSEFPSNPPHFLLFESSENRFDLKKAIKQVSLQLPESHIFLLTPLDERATVVPLLEEGVYDLIYTPLASSVELMRALDRAAERDYFMYMNERLQSSPPQQQQVQTTPANRSADAASKFAPSDENAGDMNMSYARKLFQQKTMDDCIDVFLNASSSALGSCPAVFFKYVANRRVLLASLAARLDGTDLSGLGMNFNDSESGFKSSQLRDPMSIGELSEMVPEVFGTADYFAHPIEALGEVLGIVVFLRADPGGSTTGLMKDWLMLLTKALSLIESEKRLHVTAVKDPATELLNRPNFVGKIQQEISRARRTNLPVSLLLIAVDPYGQIVSQIGQDEANVVLKMIARIIEKYSRVNDIIGRTGVDEFGILLPHTGKKGASIKAERLRRILESADFAKVLAAFPHITVSIGVSEYPSFVRDAEELQQTADEALFQIRKLGNKTCLAQAPDGFTPDFEVQEKGAV